MCCCCFVFFLMIRRPPRSTRTEHTLSLHDALPILTIEIAARPDPTRDAEVVGLLRAQVESVRRLAEGQIGNFQGRLERLHGARGGTDGFDNGLSVMIDRACAEDDWQVVGSTCPRPLRDEQAAVRAPAERAAAQGDGAPRGKGGGGGAGARGATGRAGWSGGTAPGAARTAATTGLRSWWTVPAPKTVGRSWAVPARDRCATNRQP